MPSTSIMWTTADELESIKAIAQSNRPVQERIRRLKSYLICARAREWHGRGMAVNPQEVIWAAEDWVLVLMGVLSQPSGQAPRHSDILQ